MKIISGIILLLCLFPAFALEIKGRVIKVSDGDTIKVLVDGKEEKIRLAKIDAPESKQEFGYQSTRYLAYLIYRKEVIVKYTKKGKYHRIIGVVYCEGQEINLLMVRNGYARHYRHFDNTAEYIEAERKAKQERIGLWKNDRAIDPYLYRKIEKLKKQQKKKKGF
ncbi:MAG: thermonuclease family protein [Alphaproteobacteria bacterium]|nr:thermonuclease family protein [Alphaproteobacteria bacterium]